MQTTATQEPSVPRGLRSEGVIATSAWAPQRIAARAVELAMLGIPYVHNGRDITEGLDASGFVEHCLRAADISSMFPLSSTPDWRIGTDLEPFLEERFARYGVKYAQPGDIILFRMWREDGGRFSLPDGIPDRLPARHVAILTKPNELAHLYWGRGATRTHLTGWWSARRVAAFRPHEPVHALPRPRKEAA